MKNIRTLVIIAIIFATAYIIFNRTPNKRSTQLDLSNKLRRGEIVNQVSLAFEENGAKVDLSEVHNGCPRMDCIPSIDEPIYESIDSGDEWLKEDDSVFVFARNNITRIYPQRIMNWHEIVNDWYGDDPIVVTFCPLCGSALAFVRKVNGTVTEFGVSGKLHNSDLVMYDRLEGSGWQQITGEAIFGPAARRSEVLDPLFLIIINWLEAKQKYPNAEVLSRETGYSRNYDIYPYGSYEKDGQLLFGRNEDERLHPKAWVYGITVGDDSLAIPEEAILETNEIDLEIGNQNIKAINTDGIISFQNTDTNEEIIATRLFWFAWAAFNPTSQLHLPE